MTCPKFLFNYLKQNIFTLKKLVHLIIEVELPNTSTTKIIVMSKTAATNHQNV